jgi:hypothetical protein
MEAPRQSAAAEAKQLNVTLEREGDEWIAVLPPHPDLKDDEAIGFPAPSENEALDEARAYRSIEQSKVFKFEYDEKADEYQVTFKDKTFHGKYLAPTYQQAQKAYAEFINKPEAPAPEPAAPAPAKRRRRTSNGGQQDLAVTEGTRPQPKAIPPDPNITSGIGSGPGQLPPATQRPPVGVSARAEPQNPWQDISPWDQLSQRLDRLENVLRDALQATAKSLEELKNR